MSDFHPDLLTLQVTLVLLAIIAVYDIWTLLRRGYTTTISWNLYQMACRFPIIAFALGVVFGHLFWPNFAASLCPGAMP